MLEQDLDSSVHQESWDSIQHSLSPLELLQISLANIYLKWFWPTEAEGL